MRRALAAIACVLLAAAVFGSSTSAQDPPLDLGQENVLLLACEYGKQLAEAEFLTVKNCRRHKPEQYDGFNVVVTTRLVTNEYGAYIITYRLHKSLWSVRGVNVVSG